MILSKANLSRISAAYVQKPDEACFALPERVLQFGTGVLLRGLPDFFIDKANKAGIFGGRIVVVKSTDRGGTDDFATQDGLYTHYVRGIENGVLKEETIINSSISRVLAAGAEWPDVLACAANKDLQLIISNTTEAGLVYQPDDNLNAAPPQSFPGKLTAFLYERYKIFNGTEEAGMVIIPTELIPDNGKVLQDICVKLATAGGLEDAFIHWLTTANDFCSSLVDSIVPGALSRAEAAEKAVAQGYEDALHISSESFRLWVIETTRERTKNLLSFSKADAGVVITDNIAKYRELKLRLLNAAHTFTCGLAIVSGFVTVREAMANPFFEAYITALMLEEITPLLIGKDSITKAEAIDFAQKVLDRFRNPYIEHLWQSICTEYTSKMALRCVPLIVEYYRRKRDVPKRMTTGFAAYILYMNSVRNAAGAYISSAWGKSFIIHDDKAATLNRHCYLTTPEAAVHAVLSDVQLWGEDLSALPGFETSVMKDVRKFLEQTPGAYVKPANLMYA